MGSGKSMREFGESKQGWQDQGVLAGPWGGEVYPSRAVESGG